MVENPQGSSDSNTSPGTAQKAAGDGNDPLASLHRMSTTAGVASQDYVAINLFAVLATIGGLLSALVFVSHLLLIIPAATLVLGFAALRQIGNSNGTQTGRVGAWIGIVLAAGLSAALLTQAIREHQRVAADRREVLSLCEKLESGLVKGEYDSAYALFTERFRVEKKVDKDIFRQRFEHLAPPAFGKLESVKSNGLVSWIDSGEPGVNYAQTMLIFKWTGSNEQPRFPITCIQTAGQGWQIADLPQLFAAPQSAPPAGGPQ